MAARDPANRGAGSKNSSECAKHFVDIGVVRELVHTRRLPGRIASKGVTAGGLTETECHADSWKCLGWSRRLVSCALRSEGPRHGCAARACGQNSPWARQ